MSLREDAEAWRKKALEHVWEAVDEPDPVDAYLAGARRALKLALAGTLHQWRDPRLNERAAGAIKALLKEVEE